MHALERGQYLRDDRRVALHHDIGLRGPHVIAVLLCGARLLDKAHSAKCEGELFRARHFGHSVSHPASIEET